MNKKILVVVLASVLGTSLPTFAQKNQQVEEPLRLRDDREMLIQHLTDEKVNQAVNPMTPEEIRKLKENTLDVEYEISKPVLDPKVNYKTIEINSKNIAKIKKVYLSPNYSSTLLILDKRGNFWPIDKYVLPISSDVIEGKAVRDGTIVLTPKKYALKGNLTIFLQNNKTPITLTLDGGKEQVDYQVTVRVDDYGPNSQMIAYDKTFAPKGYTDLSSEAKFAVKDKYQLLDGITPTGYKKRETTNDSVEAWSKDKYLFIKTKAQLIAPSVIENDKYSIVKATDGSYLYTIPFIQQVLLSMGGNIIQVGVK